MPVTSKVDFKYFRGRAETEFSLSVSATVRWEAGREASSGLFKFARELTWSE